MPQEKLFIFGYDPGGNGDHGVALIEVEKAGERYIPKDIALLDTYTTVAEVIGGCESALGHGKIAASGIDTLTAWSRAWSGLRPADDWLRSKYKRVAFSVDSSNHINGSMSINGALILQWLATRPDKGGVVTEAHPKVCFFALKGGTFRHPWSTNLKPPPPADLQQSKTWLLDEFKLPHALLHKFGAQDHTFDALLACLGALRGLNLDWTSDLHQLPGSGVVHPFGQTHYWWPDPITLPKG